MRPSLEGLIKWTSRPEWDEPVDSVFAMHLSALNEYELDPERLVERIGEAGFNMLQSFAFEDFLASDPEHGSNPIDVYLVKRGWKETATTRAYLAALRNSVPSLYEVSGIVPGVSMLVRDLVRGGEPIRVEEKAATSSLHQWDILAARVVPVRDKAMLGGGVLLLDRQAADGLVAEVGRLLGVLRSDHARMAKERGIDLPEATVAAAIEALDTLDLVLRSSAFLFSTAWLRKVIDETDPANRPTVRTREGDEVEAILLRFRLRPKVTLAQVREALKHEPELHPAGRSMWNWAVADTRPAPGRDEGGIRLETWLDEGSLVLGNVELGGRAVQFSSLSRARADRGAEMLSRALAGLVSPAVEVEPEYSGEAAEIDLSEEEKQTLVHGFLDTHYRKVLDEPLPVLGGMTPRQAATTPKQRQKAIDWLKDIENRTRGDMPDAAGYDFSWMWLELGLGDHRR